MSKALVTIHAARAAKPTILGQEQAQLRIPTGGKIRAGIKVLTRRAAENRQAKAIYERGVAAQLSFEEIERKITEAVPELKTPLVPKNVPWFTVRPGDFPNPAIAQQIMDEYAEDRGDGVKRLYRFPVVFPADLWQSVMPHELVAWGANERKFWSEYSADGRERYCTTYAPVPKDDSGRRTIRIWGGRKSMRRPDNGGLCNPECCPEFQSKKCNLSGRFIFFIPGIKSIDAFELHTNSFYAMSKAIEQFETLAFMRGGRISGFLDDKQTSFYITKKLREVTHIDEQGKPVRVAHWLIELEAPIDVTALLCASDEDTATMHHAHAAAQVLEGVAYGHVPDAQGDEPPMDNVINAQVMETVEEIDPLPEEDETAFPPRYAAPKAQPEQKAAADVTPARSATGARNQQAPQQDGPTEVQIRNAVSALGIDPERYAAYAAKRWGPGWKMNVNGRRSALDEVASFRDDPAFLSTKIEAELDVFS